MAAEELDLEARELCPDGACIGVIGADGLCKVCRKAGSGTPFRGAVPVAVDDEDAEEISAAAPQDGGESEFDDASRKLCPDGTCIGVIGADGLCKICGARG